MDTAPTLIDVIAESLNAQTKMMVIFLHIFCKWWTTWTIDGQNGITLVACLEMSYFLLDDMLAA